VEAGTAFVDKSAITGESDLIETTKEESVFAGTFVESGYLEIIASKTADNSAISNIVRLVEEAQKNKSNTEKFIQRFATYYTPFILILSISLMVIAPLAFNLNLKDAIYRGLVLLVISCPCALTLSTPLGMVAGLSKLSKEGILVKGSIYLEELGNVKTFAFDKTGTLTVGKIEVKDFIKIASHGTESEFLKIAGSIESKSEHNIAEAIVKYVDAQNIAMAQLDSFQTYKGQGVKATFEGKQYLVGSSHLLDEFGISIPEDTLKKYNLNKRPYVLFASLDRKEPLGVFILSDKLRITAPFVLYELINRGYSTLILSGDKEETVNQVADSIYIQHKHGDLLPENKIEKIEQYKKNSGGIVMVGDGINDAPSLSAANVGISFGDKATDIAVETSDISILSNNLMKILVLLDITNITNRKIKQNIWISIIVKFGFAILTVFGLMNLWMAVGIGDIGVSLFIMANGLLIFRYKNKYRKDDALEKQQDFMETFCPNCETVNKITSHHDKPLRPNGENLVCWMSEFEDNIACDYHESLICMKCHEKLILQ
jgi:Cd2+/Zn2+-exporting ATPase